MHNESQDHRKVRAEARTLDSQIVSDGVYAMSHLDSSMFSKDQYFIVGGVATQSYLPSTCRRSTGDIDFSTMRPLSFSDFKKFLQPTADVLRSLGYYVNFQKARVNQKLIYGSQANGENVIETVRFGEERFKPYETIRANEMDRSRKKKLEGREGDIRVCSPEDIIVPKISRSAFTLARLPELKDDPVIDYASKVDDEFVRKNLHLARQLKDEAKASPTDLDVASRARLVADVYDIKVLSVLTGYNESLLGDAFNAWPRIHEHPAERNFLLATLLPEIHLVD